MSVVPSIVRLAGRLRPAKLLLMNIRVHQLLAEAQSLPAEDRSLLARALLDSIEGELAVDEAAIEKAWVAESQRRSDELKRGAAAALPWEEVKAKLLAL
jgi:putative addiction module component (TIGR02574 family)